MDSNDYKTNQEPQHRSRIFLLFVLCVSTLFLISFSVTSFILMNSYRLVFVGENFSNMQQELTLLKNEISRKDAEIEELKLQLANTEGESSFANQPLNFIEDYNE